MTSTGTGISFRSRALSALRRWLLSVTRWLGLSPLPPGPDDYNTTTRVSAPAWIKQNPVRPFPGDPPYGSEER